MDGEGVALYAGKVKVVHRIFSLHVAVERCTRVHTLYAVVEKYNVNVKFTCAT